MGLVTADDFRKAREYVDEAKVQSDRQAEEQRLADQEALKRARDNKRKAARAVLSFAGDGEEEEDTEELFISRKKQTKNPAVDTSFLPDRDRDSALQARKKLLADEWLREQEVIKQDMLEVVYSYWDGSGHRKAMEIKKGTTVGRFLELVKTQLSPDFPEIRGLGVDSLLYVKEDLIIPQVFYI